MTTSSAVNSVHVRFREAANPEMPCSASSAALTSHDRGEIADSAPMRGAIMASAARPNGSAP